MDRCNHITSHHREPWNKGKLVGQKAPLRLKDGTKTTHARSGLRLGIPEGTPSSESDGRFERHLMQTDVI